MEKLKDKKFAFRVSERDLNQIRIKAKRARMTVTDYLVTTALGKEIVVIDGVEQLRRWQILKLFTPQKPKNWKAIKARSTRLSKVRAIGAASFSTN